MRGSRLNMNCIVTAISQCFSYIANGLCSKSIHVFTEMPFHSVSFCFLFTHVFPGNSFWEKVSPQKPGGSDSKKPFSQSACVSWEQLSISSRSDARNCIVVGNDLLFFICFLPHTFPPVWLTRSLLFVFHSCGPYFPPGTPVCQRSLAASSAPLRVWTLAKRQGRSAL